MCTRILRSPTSLSPVVLPPFTTQVRKLQESPEPLPRYSGTVDVVSLSVCYGVTGYSAGRSGVGFGPTRRGPSKYFPDPQGPSILPGSDSELDPFPVTYTG